MSAPKKGTESTVMGLPEVGNNSTQVIDSAVPSQPTLEPLPNVLAKPRARVRKVEVVASKEGAEATASCDPDDRWRAAARAHLQELQQLAASDAKRFARFEAVEGSITSAIGAAANSANCAAVDRQIQKLAQEMTR